MSDGTVRIILTDDAVKQIGSCLMDELPFEQVHARHDLKMLLESHDALRTQAREMAEWVLSQCEISHDKWRRVHAAAQAVLKEGA